MLQYCRHSLYGFANRSLKTSLFRNSSVRTYSGSTSFNEKEWEVVIGIEVHAQLQTKHKLLSHTEIQPEESNDNDIETKEQKDYSNEDNFFRFETTEASKVVTPNTLVGLCDGGLPGALPSKKHHILH